jgi:hypothetical protein
MDPQPAANIITELVSITPSGYTLNRRTGHVVQQITLKNTSSITVTGPIYFALENLSANTSVTNLTGLTANHNPTSSPYLVASSTDLAPDATLTLTLEFTNPSSGGITYTARVITGPGTP